VRREGAGIGKAEENISPRRSRPLLDPHDYSFESAFERLTPGMHGPKLSLYSSEGSLRSIARSCLIALLICGLLDLPAFASNDKSLGMVIESKTAGLGATAVAIGTTVYPGDSLWTDTGGTLRLKIGAGQIYLLSSSNVTLGESSSAIQATVSKGTVGFSSTASDRLELVIPEGILRAANGQPAYGQVSITAPNEVVISAYRGALVLDNDGDLHTIGAGTSFRVTMALENDVQKPEGAETTPEVKFVPQKRRHLVFALILTGIIAAGVAYPLYRELSESPSKPSK
jgi:hypothetical protein